MPQPREQFANQIERHWRRLQEAYRRTVGAPLRESFTQQPPLHTALDARTVSLPRLPILRCQPGQRRQRLIAVADVPQLVNGVPPAERPLASHADVALCRDQDEPCVHRQRSGILLVILSESHVLLLTKPVVGEELSPHHGLDISPFPPRSLRV